MDITKVLGKFVKLDGHYRQPTGIVGRIVGESMAQQHVPENRWTVSLLQVQPTDAVLEVGFGPGIAIQRVTALAHQGYIAGIDFSQTMVEAARKRNAVAIKEGHVDLRYGNVVMLPFDNERFDKAFSIHTLYFWPDPLHAIQELYRVLKSGGTLILTILPKEKWPGWEEATLCHVYNGDDVMGLMQDVGFTQTRVEVPPTHENVREVSVIGLKNLAS